MGNEEAAHLDVEYIFDRIPSGLPVTYVPMAKSSISPDFWDIQLPSPFVEEHSLEGGKQSESVLGKSI